MATSDLHTDGRNSARRCCNGISLLGTNVVPYLMICLLSYNSNHMLPVGASIKTAPSDNGVSGLKRKMVLESSSFLTPSHAVNMMGTTSRGDLQQQNDNTSSAQSEISSTDRSSSNNMSSRFLAGLVGGVLAGVLLLAGAMVWMMLWLCRSSKRNKQLSRRALVELSGSSSGTFLPHLAVIYNTGGCQDYNSSIAKFSLSELASATNGFHESNIIGMGSSSLVYTGLLSDGRRVAIKTRNLNPGKGHDYPDQAGSVKGCSNSISTEHQILSSVDHEHIVKLLGYCSTSGGINDRTKSYQGPGRWSRLLVYEAMENGSLRYQLHGGGTSHGAILGWEQRLEVALQVSKAIRFLHVYAEPCNIIHGNISSENILLDSSWNAKLAGFGRAVHSVSPADLIYPNGAPPDLAAAADPSTHNNRPTAPSKSGDVYCFGLVLVELITGRKACEVASREYLRSLARSLEMIKDGGSTIMNHYGGDYDEYALNGVLDARLLLPRGAEGALKKALELAVWCCCQPHHDSYRSDDDAHEGELSDNFTAATCSVLPTIVDAVAGLEQVLRMFKQGIAQAMAEADALLRSQKCPLGASAALDELD